MTVVSMVFTTNTCRALVPCSEFQRVDLTRKPNSGQKFSSFIWQVTYGYCKAPEVRALKETCRVLYGHMTQLQGSELAFLTGKAPMFSSMTWDQILLYRGLFQRGSLIWQMTYDYCTASEVRALKGTSSVLHGQMTQLQGSELAFLIGEAAKFSSMTWDQVLLYSGLFERALSRKIDSEEFHGYFSKLKEVTWEYQTGENAETVNKVEMGMLEFLPGKNPAILISKISEENGIKKYRMSGRL